MDSRLPFANAGCSFLALVSAVESMPGIEEFDSAARVLFNMLVLNWLFGKPLTVRQAINQEQLGERASLQMNLRQLISKELIVAEYQIYDRRKKYLCLGKFGKKYINNLSVL